MFTLIGYNEVASAAAAWVNVAGAKDRHVHVEDDTIYVPDFATKVLWCAALGRQLSRGRLESPSLRRLSYLGISPSCNLETLETANFPQLNARYTGESPISLVAGEGLEAKVRLHRLEDDTVATVGVCLGDAPVSPVRGEIWTVRFTYASLTPITGEWVNTEIEFDETLPVGRYQVVGALLWMGHGLLFRLVPIGSKYCPGGLTTGWAGQWTPIWQRYGNMGIWCEFHSSTPPSIDILSRSEAPGEGTGYLDIIKIA